MPVYLVHGFRWPREGFTGVRVHAIVHNLEDCSVEYIQNENSKREILSSFRKLYPEQMQHLENAKTGQSLDLLEQYDPEDEYGPDSVSQPYAFVGDRVVMIAGGSLLRRAAEPKPKQAEDIKGKGKAESPIGTGAGNPRTSRHSQATQKSDLKSPMSPGRASNSKGLMSALSVNVEDIMSSGPAVTPQAWEALAELRDKIAEGQKIGWWVVYNGDPERPFDDMKSDSDFEEGEAAEHEEEEEEAEPEGARTPTQDFVNLPMVTSTDKTSTHQGRGRQRHLQQTLDTSPRNLQAPQTTTYHQSATSPTSSTSQASAASTTSSASQPKPNKGREPPPVTLPSMPTRTNPIFSKQQPPSSMGYVSSSRSPPKPQNLPEPARKVENIPEPTKAKEIAKKEGLRKKFFGKKA